MDLSKKEEFKKGIEEFAYEYVTNETYKKPFPKGPKIIHDPLWGTIKLQPWEVALLDLPLFQRLRQIHQTSLVYYVFPGCSHTRFEHTLGVIQQAQKMMDAVNKQHEDNKKVFEHRDINNIRLAALFHDCGHSCFSHISEELYEACEDMKTFIESEEMPRCHSHELFSAMVLKTKEVKKYINELESEYKITFDINKAADFIVGKVFEGDDKKRQYETQVINGPFDADKLDYIFRDAHYSGIPIGLDLDRLWASCDVCETSNGENILTLHQSSVTPLEQILFSKINLFSIVYQHPKIRAAEKMFQGIIEKAKEDKSISFDVSGKKLDMNKSTDYLWLTDESFFAEALKRDKNDPLHKMIHNIKYRRFLVRALTISKDTIDDSDDYGFIQLRKLNQKSPDVYKAKRELSKEIIEDAKLNKKLDIQDVWVDLPSDQTYGEADRTFVKTASNKIRKLSEIFPITYWGNLYKTYKWRGHVFCPVQYQEKIHKSAVRVLSDKFDIKFNEFAGHASHVKTPIETKNLRKKRNKKSPTCQP
jgi:uncharacterized protein